MAGFLLADDAVAARKSVFDDWLDEQKRNAEQATQSIAQPLQQTVQDVVQPLSDAVQQRKQVFDDWLASRQQPEPAPATASVSQPEPTPALAPVAPPSPPTTPDAQQRASVFDDWLNQRQQQVQHVVSSVLPHAEEPATASDQVPSAPGGPDLGKNWKTQFDFGQTYTGDYRTGTPHRGVDLVPSSGQGIGSEVDAFTPGKVTNVFRDPGGAGGLVVYVQDDQGLTHAYMHLNSANVKIGDQVQRGQAIATMGESGTEGSPHLHYEVRKNAASGDPLDQLIDPRPYVSGAQQQPGPVQRVVQAAGQTLQDTARAAAQQAGIDPDIFVRQIQQESGFNPNAQSPAGAVGIAQFMPNTAKGLNLDPTDAVASLFAAAKLDAQNLLKYGGDWAKTLAAYNAGPGAVDRYGGVPPYEETQRYVRTILGGAQQNAADVVARVQQAGSDVLGGLGQGAQDVARRAQDLAASSGELVRSTGQSAQDALRQLDETRRQIAAENDRYDQQQRDRRNQVLADISGFKAPSLTDVGTAVQDFARNGPIGAFSDNLRGLGQDLMSPAPDWLTNIATGGPITAVNRALFTNPVAETLGGVRQEVLPTYFDPGVPERLRQDDALSQSAMVKRMAGREDQITPAERDAELRTALTVAPIEGGLEVNPGFLRSIGSGFGRLFRGATNPELATVAEPAAAPTREALISELNAASARRVANDDLLRSINARAAERIAADDFLRDPANYDEYGVLKGFQPETPHTYDQFGVRTDFTPEAPAYSGRGVELDPFTGQEMVPAGLARPTLGERLQALTDEVNASMGQPGARQAGAINPVLAARLGGALGGGYLGYQSAPEDATPAERVARTTAGAALGLGVAHGVPELAGALRGAGASQAELDALRPLVLNPSPAKAPPGTLAQNLVSYGKGNLLSSPTTHLTNIISQAVELARQPIVAAAGGDPGVAFAGLTSGAHALPDAGAAFVNALKTGASAYANRPGVTSNPFFKLLSATDDFFRTVGGGMGRGMEAQRLLDAAGNPTNARDVSSIIQSNSKRIIDAGDQAAKLSVFQAGEGQGLGHAIASFKDKLLESPNIGKQLAGVLFDALVPFSGIPSKIWDIGLGRTPGIGEVRAVAKFIKGFKVGDAAAQREALGDLAVQSVVSTMIISNVTAGNITGEDDPEHPHSVKIGGQWVDYSNWGAFQLPMAETAAVADAFRKTGQKPDADTLSRLNDIMNSTAKALLRSNYLYDAVNLLSQIGQGSFTGVLGRAGLGYEDRLIPAGGALNWLEGFDAKMKDVDPGLAGAYQRPMSRIPGLAGMLPEKVNPATGRALERPKVGLGTLLGAENPERSDPLTAETARLDRLGYKVSVPTQYPDTVSWHGTEIKLRPDEQRAITQQLGAARADLAREITTPSWDRNSDDAKAAFLKRELDRISNLKTQAWLGVVNPQDAEQRLTAAQRSTGRLVATR